MHKLTSFHSPADEDVMTIHSAGESFAVAALQEIAAEKPANVKTVDDVVRLVRERGRILKGSTTFTEDTE